MRLSTVIAVCALLFRQAKAQGQVEVTIPFPDSTVDLYSFNHKVDNNGNLYLLAQATEFYDGPNYPIEGMPLLGTLLCETSRTGGLLWQRLYPTFQDSLYASVFTSSYIPTRNFFFKKNGAVLLPFSIYSGYNGWNVRRNAVIIADQQTGTILDHKIFRDTCCSNYDLWESNVVDDTLINFYNVRKHPATPLFYEKRTGDYVNPIAVDELDTSWVGGLAYMKYDPDSRQYLEYKVWSPELVVYNDQFSQVRTINFYDTAERHYIAIKSIATNRDYYVINYSCTPKSNDSGYNYLTVLDKAGNIISERVAPRFQAIWLANDNTIWSISDASATNARSDKPVMIQQINLKQRVMRTLSAGKRYVVPTDISATDNEVIVTGTYATSQPALYPNKRPSQLYVYRQRISDIPLVPEYDFCDGVFASPNPVHSILNISLGANGGQQSHTVSVLNSLGQQMSSDSFSGSYAQTDFSSFAAGTFFVRVLDKLSGKICVSKVVKE